MLVSFLKAPGFTRLTPRKSPVQQVKLKRLRLKQKLKRKPNRSQLKINGAAVYRRQSLYLSWYLALIQFHLQ